jgi:hypothetical protein
VPLREITWGVPAALSVIVTAPLRGPVAVGVNVTLIVQLAPAATVLPGRGWKTGSSGSGSRLTSWPGNWSGTDRIPAGRAAPVRSVLDVAALARLEDHLGDLGLEDVRQAPGRAP